MLQNNALGIGAIKRCMKHILWEIKTGSQGNEEIIKKERQIFTLIVLYLFAYLVL